MSITNESYSTKTTQSQSNQAPESGDGGGVMDVWTQDRQTLLRNFVGGGTFVNNSSFTLPSGVVDSSSGSDYIQFENNEEKMGVNASGQMLGVDGTPLSGTANIESGNTSLASETVSGSFVLSGKPMYGVTVGSNVDRETSSFTFSPSTQGISVVKEDFGGNVNLGTVQYGGLDGKVTDYYGDPVKGVTVSAPGLSDITDVSGKYNMLAPGGTSVEITTLGGGYTFTLTPSAGQELTQDVQFPMLMVAVKDADYTPISNAPVDVNGKRYYTDSNGEVSFPEADIGDYDIVVMEDFKASNYSVSNQGQLYQLEVSPGSSFGSHGTVEGGSVTIDIVDAQNGNPVADVEAEVVAEDRMTLSNDGGTVKLLSEQVGDTAIVKVAGGDNRYETEVVSVDVPKSGAGYSEIILSRGGTSPTY